MSDAEELNQINMLVGNLRNQKDHFEFYFEDIIR